VFLNLKLILAAPASPFTSAINNNINFFF